MIAARTRGQPAAAEAVRAMLATSPPHAVLLVGPAGVGKTTLAVDLAAGLLCGAAVADRPCGACRPCRMAASGNHPDLHRLVPEGPGGQIRIGARTNPEAGTVRRLVADLALLPVEGGHRVAIVEHADRLNEDAQSALLKTLEEPPSRVTIVLCADEEERLLPTVRSRCARVRLGAVPTRDLEALLVERGAADAPTGARLARLSGGRPGIAIAYAEAPGAVVARGELARLLLDLGDARPAQRLALAPDLLSLASAVADGLEPSRQRRTPAGGGGTARGAAPVAVAADGLEGGADAGDGALPAAGPARLPAAERRRAAHVLVDVWQAVARDLAVVQAGDPGAVRDVGLIDDLQTAAVALPPGSAAWFLGRLARTAALLDGNVAPELAVDVLLVAWPRAGAVPGGTAG